MLTETKEIEKEISSFLCRQFLFDFDESDITKNTDLFNAGIIDSFGAVELISFLESKFKITVLDEELISDSIRSLDALVKFVKGKSK